MRGPDIFEHEALRINEDVKLRAKGSRKGVGRYEGHLEGGGVCQRGSNLPHLYRKCLIVFERGQKGKN